MYIYIIIPHFSLSDYYGSIIFALCATVVFLVWWSNRKEKLLSLIDPHTFDLSHTTIVHILKNRKKKETRTARILKHYVTLTYQQKLADAKDYKSLIKIIEGLMKTGNFPYGGYGLTSSCPGSILYKSIETCPHLSDLLGKILDEENTITDFTVILNTFDPKIWMSFPKKLGIQTIAHQTNRLISKELKDEEKHTRHFLNYLHASVKTGYFSPTLGEKEKWNFAQELKTRIEKTQEEFLRKNKEKVLV